MFFWNLFQFDGTKNLDLNRLREFYNFCIHEITLKKSRGNHISQYTLCDCWYWHFVWKDSIGLPRYHKILWCFANRIPRAVFWELGWSWNMKTCSIDTSKHYFSVSVGMLVPMLLLDFGCSGSHGAVGEALCPLSPAHHCQIPLFSWLCRVDDLSSDFQGFFAASFFFPLTCASWSEKMWIFLL